MLTHALPALATLDETALAPELAWIVRAMKRVAAALESGAPVGAAEVDLMPAGAAPVQKAFTRVLEAAAAREERLLTATPPDDVLLALVELARDQASELAQQNEELRRAKAALEEQNRTLQQQNEALVRERRVKDDFLATMSHELRTPLTAIQGYSDLLLEEYAGPISDDQRSLVSDIRRSGEHLLVIINDLLDMAKMDAGRMEFHRFPMDLSLCTTEAVEISRSMAIRKRQTVELASSGAVRCVADPQRVRQIVLNLLSNAVKFTPEGGRIWVTVRSVAGEVEVTVRDSGIGIDPAHHGLIFEAFRQVDSGQSRAHRGTGLGLTLVKKFCVAMGGDVRVDSRKGEGATFTVRLPAAEGKALAPAVALAEANG